ncbi:MAG TPA: hypothetical protein ENK13_03105 [Thermopetrobacter sp.]|nr:hypothetical protein [Thermopetrobacter sp.]
MTMAMRKVTCTPLPPRYREIEDLLAEAYGREGARAMARAMCEIDMGAGDYAVRELLEREGGFSEGEAERMARILFLFHRSMTGHAA